MTTIAITSNMSSSTTPRSYYSSSIITNNQETTYEHVGNQCTIVRKNSRNETIHSGNLMISEIDDDGDGANDERVAQIEDDHEYQSDYGDGQTPDVVITPSSEVKSFALDDSSQETTMMYHGTNPAVSVAIDKSLSRLFHCMNLAYSNGKLTSPKWKSFKGLRLKLKDKIRLNNTIWRIWHMQYIKRKVKTPFFQCLANYDVHNKPEAILLEGKYWKRGSGTVSAEYRKWRSFNHRTKSNNRSDYLSSSNSLDKAGSEYQSGSFPGTSSFDDDFFMDLSDNSLLNSLLPSYGDCFEFPNPREIARSGFGADCIQPGLTQLQPVMDFMDTFEPFQGFMSRNISVLPPVLEEPTVQSSDQVTPTYSGQQEYRIEQQPVSQPQQQFGVNNFQQYDMTSVTTSNSVLANQVPAIYPSQVQPSSNVMETQISSAPTSSRPTPAEIYNAYNQQSMLVNKQGSQNVSDNFAVPSIPNTCKPIRTRHRNGNNNQQLETNVPFGMNNQPSNLNQYNYISNQATSSPNFVTNTQSETGAYSMTNPAQSMAGFNGTNQVDLLQLAGNQATVSSAASNIIAQLLAGTRNNVPSQAPSRTLSQSSTEIATIPQSGYSKIVSTSSSSIPASVSNSRFETSRGLLRPGTQTTSQDDMSYVSHRRLQQLEGVGPIRKISSPARICSPHPMASPSRRREMSPSSQLLSQTTPPPLSTRGAHPVKKERHQHRENRRVSHINAEQKRRCNIKNGFDTLRSLLPSISTNANTKISKAAMLSKAAEFIRTLRQEQNQQKKQCDVLKKEIDSLNHAISVFQDQLPATGAPVTTCPKTAETKQYFENYVRERTHENWKFWVFSMIMGQLLESFESSVSTRSWDEMHQTMNTWSDQNCSLLLLRKHVQDSLLRLSTSSSILTSPSSLPQEAILSVNQRVSNSSSSSQE